MPRKFEATEASLAEIKETWKSSASTAPIQAPLGAARLSEDDLILIESFLQRRHQLALNIRSRMAAEIFRRVEYKLNIDPERRSAIENLLESAVRERRAGM